MAKGKTPMAEDLSAASVIRQVDLISVGRKLTRAIEHVHLAGRPKQLST